ncbi:universal stress protein [Haladaptatus caseinilyticus]|uniref:universal stress protein n=1 Tax=Haladaptatus caseinilyticus TaxID=2993314 RepID=UPI00224AA262|nr:universal stress protein [Haladaptatus caseinilyticus]
MDKILTVVEPVETDIQLLKEAGSIAATAGVELVVLSLVIDGSDRATTEAMDQWLDIDAGDERTNTKIDIASRFATAIASETLDSLDVNYTAIGDHIENTRPSAKVINVAESHGCDHIYVTNRSHSPTGKALFGEMAQSIILNFDGYVTVRTAKH